MLSRIRQLGKDTAIYGLGDTLRRTIGFLLVPLYTRVLTPADYGLLSLSAIFLSLSTLFARQGLRNAFFRHYTFSEYESKRPELLSTTFYYLATSSFLIYAVLFLLAEQLGTWFFHSGDDVTLIVQLTLVNGFLQTFVLIPRESFRAKLQATKYVSISLLGFVLQVVLNIYFVVVLRIGVVGVLLGNALSSVAVALVTLFMVRTDLRPRISKKMLKDLLSFGLPLIPMGLSFWLLKAADQVLLERLASTEEVGLYALGNRFANILAIFVIAPFSTAWGPFFYRIAREDKAPQTFKTIATYFLLMLCFIGMGLIVLTPPVIKIVAGREFWDAYQVVPFLVYASVVWGMVQIFDLGINIAKKTKHFFYIIGAGAAVNAGLNLALIPTFGMIGAAFGFFVAYLVIMVITLYISQKYYYVPYEKTRMAKICGVFLVVTVTSVLLSFSNPILDWAYRFLLILAFCVLLYAVRFFREQEKRFASQFYHGFRQKKGLRGKIQFALELIRSG